MRPKILKLSGRVVMIHPYFSNSIFFQQKCKKFIKTPLQICQKAETYPGFGTPPKRRFFGIKWGQLSPLLIWAPPPLSVLGAGSLKRPWTTDSEKGITIFRCDIINTADAKFQQKKILKPNLKSLFFLYFFQSSVSTCSSPKSRSKRL